MQCFKAAWLVNVLHEGIGLPRIIDQGGGKLLPSSSHNEPSSTETEAMSMAADKNLGPSFQSVDTIGDTAISWTLGKMVIEASRDVPTLPPSSSMPGSGDWLTLPERLRLGVFDGVGGKGLEQFGSGRGYAATLLVLLAIVLFLLFRLNRRVFRAASPRRLAQRWKRDLEDSEEETFVGGVSLRTRPSPQSSGVFGLLSTLKRLVLTTSHAERPRTLKHFRSSPAVLSTSSTGNLYLSSTSTSAPQSFASTPPPSSPRKKAFRQVGSSVRPSLDSEHGDYESSLHFGTSSSLAPSPVPPTSTLPTTTTSISPSTGPPRAASRRPSPSSVQGSVDFHLLPLRDILGRTLPSSSSPASTLAATSHQSSYHGSGWNDIPDDLLPSQQVRMASSRQTAAAGTSSSSRIYEEDHDHILTPPASISSLAGSQRNSRNSSRVDLTLSGLTGRAASRTGSGNWDTTES